MTQKLKTYEVAGAVLGTMLLVFGLKSVAGVIYSSEKPEKQGYAIAVTDTGKGDQTGTQAGGGSEPAVSLGKLMAMADAKKGEAVSKKCASCHDFTKGGANKTGPNLWGLVNRKPGTHEGFTYSDAMKGMADKPWTYEALFAYIKAPKEVVPGNKMAFGGIPKDTDRADLLAYLGSLNDTPAPFPKP